MNIRHLTFRLLQVYAAVLLRRFDRQEDDLYVFSHPPSLAHAQAGRFLRFVRDHLDDCVEARFVCNEIPRLMAGLEATDA
jgi:hypothetical protein